jgi:hypothetical protein
MPPRMVRAAPIVNIKLLNVKPMTAHVAANKMTGIASTIASVIVKPLYSSPIATLFEVVLLFILN